MRRTLSEGQGLPSFTVYLRQPKNKIETYLSLSEEPHFVDLRLGQRAEFALTVDKYIFLESPTFSCSADPSADLLRSEVSH